MKTDLGAKIFQKIEDDKRFFEDREKEVQDTFNNFFEGYLLENSGKFNSGYIRLQIEDIRKSLPKNFKYPKISKLIQNFCKHHGFKLSEDSKLDSFSDGITITIPKVEE